MAEGKEKHFLHVNKPEIDLPKDVDVYSDVVYEKGRDNLKLFIEKGYLIPDTASRIYVYAQKMGDHIQHGIVCLSSIVDYENKKIKKHEQTRKKKEDDRTKLTDVMNANAGPVWLTYKNKEAVDLKMKQIIENLTPYAEVTTEDQIVHTVSKGIN